MVVTEIVLSDQNYYTWNTKNQPNTKLGIILSGISSYTYDIAILLYIIVISATAVSFIFFRRTKVS